MPVDYTLHYSTAPVDCTLRYSLQVLRLLMVIHLMTYGLVKTIHACAICQGEGGSYMEFEQQLSVELDIVCGTVAQLP